MTVLDELRKIPGNGNCADCGAMNPRWGVVNLGILVCSICAGMHRKMGVDVSIVKSVTMDTWKIEWLENCREVGNLKANAYWESNVPPHFRRPPPGGSGDLEISQALKLEKWIKAKYQLRLFVGTEVAVSVSAARPQYSVEIDSKFVDLNKSGRRVVRAGEVIRDDFKFPGFDWSSNIFLKNWALELKKSSCAFLGFSHNLWVFRIQREE